jgi:HKD family nuclease
MKVISNHSDQTHSIIIDRLLDSSDEVIICVAFLKLSGLNKIIDKLKLKTSKCLFYIGTDFYLTEPAALRKLFNSGHSIFITKKEKCTYHPKIFYFKKKNQISILIGSANLTNGGLETNIEASLQIETETNSTVDNDFKSLISSFNEFSVHIKSDQIISDYENRYNAYKLKHTEADNQFEIELKKIIELELARNKKFEVKSNPVKSDNPNPRNRNVQVTEKDYADFEIYLPQYKEYKKNVRTSGVVNKETIQKDLFEWYLRIKELIKHEVLPDDLAFRLIDEGFPFGNGWGATIRMIWNKRFSELELYKKNEQQHLNFTYCPQTKNKKSPYYSIGGWCAQQKLRRKGLETPIWDWDYEEEKMKSLKYQWDNPSFGIGPDDELWYENLLTLEKYYSNKNNYKSVPKQETYIGGWLNEQMTLKNTGSRAKGKEKTFLHPIREGLLEELLSKNGVSWKWKEQKDRESIEEGLIKWKELEDWKFKNGGRKATGIEVKYFKDTRSWISLTRYRSKKWDKEKEKWKFEMLLKAGFPLPK